MPGRRPLSVLYPRLPGPVLFLCSHLSVALAAAPQSPMEGERHDQRPTLLRHSSQKEPSARSPEAMAARRKLSAGAALGPVRLLASTCSAGRATRAAQHHHPICRQMGPVSKHDSRLDAALNKRPSSPFRPFYLHAGTLTLISTVYFLVAVDAFWRTQSSSRMAGLRPRTHIDTRTHAHPFACCCIRCRLCCRSGAQPYR